MSHATVLIIHKASESIADILAPYDENVETEPYRDYVEGLPAEHWWVRVLRDEGITFSGADLTWTELLDTYYRRHPDRRSESDALLLDEDRRAYCMTTYNPDSKWDWWVIGGRWLNYFDIRPECDGHPDITRGESWDIAPQPLKAESAPKRCIDVDMMRRAAHDQARDRYDEFTRAVAGTPPAQPWARYLAQVKDSDSTYTIDQARTDYHAQARVRAFRDFDSWGDLERYNCDRATYALRAWAQAVPGFATLADGQWIEPGKMGWFGMSDDTESSRAHYLEHVNGIIDKADGDMIFTIVDYHI